MAKVRLDDVAVEARETWNQDRKDVPVVGLEHLEPDEIWLRQWNVNPDENTFTKGFKKGQLLFGRRRAYQKKMSLAPCDGICSGDITVIAARPEKIVPELLPFYLRTDAFFDFAMRGSGGSLSPRVKWSHISDYEFDLPPMDEQKKLAELLWAANDLKESYKKAINATDEMLKAKFREMFGDAGDDSSRGGAETRRFPSLSIGEIGVVSTGTTPSMNNKAYYNSDDICFVKPSDLSYDITNIVSSESYISREAEKVARMFNPGAVLVTCIGATIGKLGVAKIRGTCNQQINFIVPRKDKVETFYLAYSMLSLQPQLMRTAASTTVPIMNKREFSKLAIPLPPLSLQREFVAIADKAESAKANLKKSIAAIDQVMKGLING